MVAEFRVKVIVALKSAARFITTFPIVTVVLKNLLAFEVF